MIGADDRVHILLMLIFLVVAVGLLWRIERGIRRHNRRPLWESAVAGVFIAQAFTQLLQLLIR